MPGAGRALDHGARLVEHESVATVHLRQANEIALAHPGGGRRQRAPVELVHPCRGCRAATAREGESVSFAPRASSQRKRQPPGQGGAEPAAGEHDGLLAELVERLAEPDVPRATKQRSQKRVGREAPACGAGIRRVAGGDRCAERLEPVEAFVQLLEDERLQLGVPAGTLGAKVASASGGAR